MSVEMNWFSTWIDDWLVCDHLGWVKAVNCLCSLTPTDGACVHVKLYQMLQGILTSNNIAIYYRSLDIVLDIVTGLQAGHLRILGLTVASGRRFISSPKCPHQLWDPLSLLFNGCWGLFTQGRSIQCVKLNTSICCQG
jgi:hypothetical protein